MLSVSLNDRYRLGRRLGAGGMAEVFRGTMLGIEGFSRPVAIKRVLAGLSEQQVFSAMFIREAQIAARLIHPNIVSVLDFSRDIHGRLFMVMEYVDGTDLAALVETGPVPPSLAIFILSEMLRGLGYAHSGPADLAAPVIHRDVSPQNLLLSAEGAVKLADFGLAKVRAVNDAVWPEDERGKPSYMAPEQIAGAGVALDGRCDLYAAGVMLWELLAQRPLFTGTRREIFRQATFRDVVPPSRVRAGVAPDVEAVAMKLLARDRAQRFATARAAIDALLSCRDAPRDGRGELVALLAERPRVRRGEPESELAVKWRLLCRSRARKEAASRCVSPR
ncbi:MAG TPA: serine/threonine-protein kinase [Kofleriaceae bacterium]|nr:serine/threonine-protein kinase [Kofleriaceae bacterium]